MDKVIIRKGTEDDFPALLELIKELAKFEKAEDKVSNSVERMHEEKEHFDFFVAELEGKVVGIALYFFAYFTWVGKSLYLDDLYVKKAYRGNKIGTKLLSRVFEVAKNENCQRLRWQVLDWNTDAIEFYEKIGAEIDEEWYNCDFNAEGIQDYKLAT